jgi:hypothetical protein
MHSVVPTASQEFRLLAATRLSSRMHEPGWPYLGENVRYGGHARAFEKSLAVTRIKVGREGHAHCYQYIHHRAALGEFSPRRA